MGVAVRAGDAAAAVAGTRADRGCRPDRRHPGRSRGAHVAFVARTAAAVQRVACDRPNSHGIVGDVSKKDDIYPIALQILGELGRLDVLIKNASSLGPTPLRLLADTDCEDLEVALDTNLVAPFLLVRAFLPAMLDRASGHIVTIGSVADRTAFPENASYAASKFGLRALHEVLRAEIRGSGVRATLVSPSATDTALWDEVNPDQRPGFTPRRSMLRAAAVADAVRYVVSVPPDVNVDELRLSHS